jgi:hypothetical protein
MKQSHGTHNTSTSLHCKPLRSTAQKRRYPPRDEVFFVQNAGAPAAGTGLNKSSLIQKISLAEAEEVRHGKLAAATVTVVNTSNPQVINPNGQFSTFGLPLQIRGSLT